MAAINITSAGGANNSIVDSDRVVVRTSAGIPYVVLYQETEDSIQVWKGNSTTPTAFTEKDTGNNPTLLNFYKVPNVAIDSSDIIHILYFSQFPGDTKNWQARYVTFNTSTDTFSGDTSLYSLVGTTGFSPKGSIAIDANDIPHILYTERLSNMGDSYITINYSNKIGGSWKATPVQVDGQANLVNCSYPSLSIDSNNSPFIGYILSTGTELKRATSTSNNPSSFTLEQLATSEITSTRISSAVGSDGTRWVVGHLNISGDLKIVLFEETTQRTSNTITTAVSSSMSIVPDGTDIYIFFSDSNDDIAYLKYDGAWSGPTVLETGTYKDLLAKWAFWVDNDSGGDIFNHTTYYFDGSDVGAVDASGAWADETNTDDGNINTKATTIVTGTNDPQINNISIEGTNAPSSGDSIIKVKARIHGGTTASQSWGDWTNLSKPSGGWTWEKVQALEVSFVLTGTPAVRCTIYTDGRSEAISSPGFPLIAAGTNDGAVTRVEVDVITRPSGSASELDYVFLDQTATPDVLFNSLTLAAGPTSNIKLLSSISQANLKKISGITNANTKKVSEITNV